MRGITSFICGVFWPVLFVAAQGDRGIIATLSVTMGNPKPGLHMNVVNSSAKEIPDYPLNYNGNRVVALTPGGYVVTRGAIADVFDRKQPMIPPGERRSWEQSFDDLLRLPEFAEAGSYRLYWEYAGVKSREITLIRREPSKDNPPFAPKVDPRDTPPTPRAALVAFLRMLDETAVHPGFALHMDPNDVRDVVLRDTFQRRATRMGQLLHEIELKKLPAGDDLPDWRIEATPEVVTAIDKASQTFSEYFQECTLTGRDFSVRLFRDRNVWKIHVADVAPYIDFPAFDRITTAIDAVATEVRRGRYATASEAAAALRQAMEENPNGTLRLIGMPTSRPS
jgi:hypothetical protein